MDAMIGAKGNLSNRETQYGAGTSSNSSPESYENLYLCSIKQDYFW